MQTTEATAKNGRKSACLGGRFEKEGPKHLHKSTTENMSFFNRKQIFVVRKVVKTSKDN